MNNPSFDPQSAGRQFPVGANQLWLRQQPEKSRVVVKGREKEKKPIDPPPILQLNIASDPSFIHNPYLLCSCEIWDAVEDRVATNPNPSTPGGGENQLLIGQLVSSLHRLKDLDNSEKGFFVFGDLAVVITGKFRLRFCLWEYSLSGYATFLKDCFSNPFEVASAKEWDGVKESTPLSRAIADQGIKLRLRKESRHPKGAVQPSAGPTSNASTPLRPAGGSYSQDGMTSEPPAKGQRSFGAESGPGPSSVVSTPYSAYTSPGAQTGAYPGYPPTSSANMQSAYYNQQYPNSYPTSSYGYSGYGQPQQASQQQYGMSSGSSYRPQPTQAESPSSYPPPTTYAGGSYPHQGGYPTSGSSYSYSQAGNQSAGRGYMADPANPPRLAPISGHDARPQQQGQPLMKEESVRQSYDWTNQNR